MPTIADLLDAARATLRRLTPQQSLAALEQGAVLVDIREDDQIRRGGAMPEAVRIARNVLEWRCDPCSPWRDARVCDPARVLVLVCEEGYQSSLAAATLQQLGLPLATDMIGGHQAWRAVFAAPPAPTSSRSPAAG